MLGKLARYLVLAGFDCHYRNRMEDDRLVEIHHQSGRCILTRDRDLADRLPDSGVQFIQRTRLPEQLREVRKRWRLEFRPGQFFTRCPSCNRVLRVLPSSQFADRLPPRTREWISAVYRCQSCGQLYWRGSHYRDVVDSFSEWNLLENSISRGETDD